MVQQRQLFPEFKVTKGELQLCETPFTHYHLSPAPFTNKGQVHYSLLEEKKKKNLKKAMALSVAAGLSFKTSNTSGN